MDHSCMLEANFVDSQTIRLLKPYPFQVRKLHLIIMPETELKGQRKAGLLKGKIRLASDFNAPLDEMREYMERKF